MTDRPAPPPSSPASAAYPPAPWHTHGRAWAQPFLVDARALDLPPGFRPVTIADRAIGVLALIEYVAPSPLTYAELTWMPCTVTARAAGRTVRGTFVDTMYVDSAASLAGGRALWALPKVLARFAIGAREATIDTDDGAHLVLELGARGPALPLRGAGGTVQDAGPELVRFRGAGSARVAPGSLRVREARGTESWRGFATARRLPGLGVALTSFEVAMLAPQRLPREAPP